LGINMQEAYKAIADPTRRRILKYLRGGERTAGELAEYAGVGRTALSHHLMVLKMADLVRVERRGQYQVYSLNTTVFQDLLTEILSWLGGLDETPTSGEGEAVKESAEESNAVDAVDTVDTVDKDSATEV
jgi:ArsR family transcriptional regulator, arsenate/arsenite/antimonite-responsive transcriptional repressor